MELKHIGWIAGFIEGEGSFTWAGSTICVSATQVDKQPIQDLQDMLGGGIGTFSRKEVTGNIYHRWQVYGPRAAGVMMTLYPMLTRRRQSKIRQLLKVWLVKGRSKTERDLYFSCGHKKSSSYTFINSRGYLSCRICTREQHNRSQRRIRAEKKVLVTV